MLAEILHKVAGFEKHEGVYYPRPSLSGPERCIRQMVYWASKIPINKALADRFVMILDTSAWHELLTADWIQKSAYKLHSAQMGVDVVELDFLPDIGTHPCFQCDKENPKEIPNNMLHGHLDGLLQNMLEVDVHYEHKAINHFTFNRYWAGVFPLDYFSQCCLYNRALRKDIPSLEHSLLLIKNKNTEQFIDYLIFYDAKIDTAHIKEMNNSNGERQIGSPYLLSIPNIVNDAINKFATVHYHTENKTLPERPFEYGTDFPCGYCSWEDTCWEGYGEEFAARSDTAQLPESYLDACRYYLELSGHITAMTKEKEQIRDQISAALKELNTKQAKLNEYIVSSRLQAYTSVDKSAPQELIKRCTKTTWSEVINIRKPKEKK